MNRIGHVRSGIPVPIPCLGGDNRDRPHAAKSEVGTAADRARPTGHDKGNGQPARGSRGQPDQAVGRLAGNRREGDGLIGFSHRPLRRTGQVIHRHEGGHGGQPTPKGKAGPGRIRRGRDRRTFVLGDGRIRRCAAVRIEGDGGLGHRTRIGEGRGLIGLSVARGVDPDAHRPAARRRGDHDVRRRLAEYRSACRPERHVGDVRAIAKIFAGDGHLRPGHAARGRHRDDDPGGVVAIGTGQQVFALARGIDRDIDAAGSVTRRHGEADPVGSLALQGRHRFSADRHIGDVDAAADRIGGQIKCVGDQHQVAARQRASAGQNMGQRFYPAFEQNHGTAVGGIVRMYAHVGPVGVNPLGG